MELSRLVMVTVRRPTLLMGHKAVRMVTASAAMDRSQTSTERQQENKEGGAPLMDGTGCDGHSFGYHGPQPDLKKNNKNIWRVGPRSWMRLGVMVKASATMDRSQITINNSRKKGEWASTHGWDCV